MPHTAKVSAAVQAALGDIKLLKKLIHAQTAPEANAILTQHDPNLTLAGQDINEFYTSLDKGKVANLTAKDLVAHHDKLHDAAGRPQEWVP